VQQDNEDSKGLRFFMFRVSVIQKYRNMGAPQPSKIEGWGRAIHYSPQPGSTPFGHAPGFRAAIPVPCAGCLLKQAGVGEKLLGYLAFIVG